MKVRVGKTGETLRIPPEVWVILQDDREGQVYCHTHLTAHTVICGHPKEHVTDEMAATVPLNNPSMMFPNGSRELVL